MHTIDLPPAALTLLRRAPVAPPHAPPRHRGADQERALKLLADLAPWRADDYAAWVSVGMALHDTDPGDVLLDAWRRWSQQSAKYREDDDECARKWAGFGRQGFTIASLIYWARMDTIVVIGPQGPATHARIVSHG